MERTWMTTGEAARQLGVSRQHVVNLCARGALTHHMAGSHRRVEVSEIERLAAGATALTSENEKSLWLHRAVLGHLVREPDVVIGIARANIERWASDHRPDGMTLRYLARWQELLDGDLELLAQALVSRELRYAELRQNSPFAGVLSEGERRQILRSYRVHRRESGPRAA